MDDPTPVPDTSTKGQSAITSGFDCDSSPSAKFNVIRRLLLLILHAQDCPVAIGSCHLANCGAMKGVLRHLDSCPITVSNPKCPIQFCSFTRQILAHWRSCGRKCNLCTSAQEPISPTPTPSTSTASFPKNSYNFKLWDLTLEWSRLAPTPMKGDQGQDAGSPKIYTKISLHCQVFTHSEAAATKILFKPTRLQMKLIPSFILHKLGLLQHVRPLRIQFLPGEGVEELVDALKTGKHSGYVHMECDGGPIAGDGQGQGGFKPLILHYNACSKEFMGYKPTNQKDFVERLKAIVVQERVKNKTSPGPTRSQDQEPSTN